MQPPQSVFFNRVSPSSHTRNHRYAPEHTHALLEWLELHDRRVVNGTSALRMELSKVRQYATLKARNISTPETYAATGSGDDLRKNILSLAKKHFKGRDFIIKHNRAGKGLGVNKFSTIEALETFINSDGFDEPIDGIYLVQQYIESPEGRITRLEFINGKFMYAVSVDTSEGFELCPADHCQIGDAACPASKPTEEENQKEYNKDKFIILKDFKHPLISQLEEFIKFHNIEVSGIEFITDKNGTYYVYDVNCNSNYNSDAEKSAYGGDYGMMKLAEFLGKEAELLSPETLTTNVM